MGSTYLTQIHSKLKHQLRYYSILICDYQLVTIT